jgi:putative SOS response-associated peptidase YedK
LTINWRAESFPPKSPRCTVVTDGFYEWSGPKNARQPHWFHRPDHALVMLASLYKWQPEPEGGLTQVFVILTTRANGLMAPLHDRMPIVLEPASLDAWLTPATDEGVLRAMLTPAREDWLVADLASPLVNSVKNEGPELLAALRA